MDTLDDFENNQKILYFGRVFGLASKTVKPKDLQWQCYVLFGRVCDCYWEWP